MAATTRRPASHRTGNTDRQGQIRLANELIAEVNEVNHEFALQSWAELKQAWAKGECTVAFVSAKIDEMIAQKRAAKAVAREVNVPEVPAGRYAITGRDGSTDFYRVATKNGEVKLFLYVSDNQRPVTNVKAIVTILRQIVADGIEEASLRWGREMVKCRRCGAKLTDQNNPYRDVFLGPECGTKGD